MPWWMWILLGLVLLGLELMVGTFYLLFLGLAAIVVGLIAAFGFDGPLWLELLLFVGLAGGLLLLIRRPLLGRFRIQSDTRDVDSLIGEIAVASTPIAPGDLGKVEMRGSSWNARNLGPDSIAAGQRCRVEGVQGLVLSVRP